MNRMRRFVGILPIIALSLAACAAPNTADDADGSEPMASTHTTEATNAPSASGVATSPSAGEGGAAVGEMSDRVAIDDLLTDPTAFEGQPITVSENIDEVLVDDRAFLFSGTEVEGQLLVVVAPDAPIEKAIQTDRVVTVTGTLVPFTDEGLDAAGAGISIDDEALAAFEGDAVLVTTEVADPLGS